MNQEEAVARITELTKTIEVQLKELQDLADEFNISLSLAPMGDMWYTPLPKGGPTLSEYWEHYDDYKYFRNKYPDWEGNGHPGWQSSSTYC